MMRRLRHSLIGLALACCALAPAALLAQTGGSAPGQSNSKAKGATQRSDAPNADAAAETSEQNAEPATPAEPEKEELLPKLSEMAVPTVEELHKLPVDWIIIQQKGEERALVTRPVHPRPNTVDAMNKAIEESKKWPRPATEEEREAQRERREELNWLTVFVPEGEEMAEYQLPLALIRRIIYHEDLVIRRAQLFMDDGKLRDAFELLFELDRRMPNWPGLADSKNRLVFLEAQGAFERNDHEAALAYLEELHGRNSRYPQLSARLGLVADKLIGDARSEDNYRRARHFLGRLSQREPQHEVALRWRDSLLTEARGLLDEAAQASAAGKHDRAVEAATKAALVWPQTPGLAEAHRRYAGRFQQLYVGVVRWSGEPTAYPLATMADERIKRLTQFDVFEVDHVDDSTHYRTSLFEQWTPVDLGRQATFSLRPTRATWESKPRLTAAEVVSDLADRIDPSSPRFDERLFHFIKTLRVRSPYEFEIFFARVPVRTEPLFRFAVRGNRTDGPTDSEGERSHVDVLSRRFELHAQSGDRVSYRRSVPQPDGLTEYQCAEVIERRYESPERALQGLLRGEISVLTELPRWHVASLKADDRFFVVPYALPTTDVLQFHPGNKALASREFRMALASAIDRERLLRGILLREPEADAANYLITAPYARKFAAYNPLVPQRTVDLTVAASLVLAAKKSLGGEIPPLKMVCAPDATVEAVAREMIAQWKRIGITVELVTEPGAKPAEWDLVYRRLRMEEPMTQLWPFLTLDDQPRTAAVRHLPDWLRQELIALENAGDWSTANSLMHDLHRHLFADVQYIPLWEFEDYFVARKNIRGFSSEPMHPYQNIERWIVQPWIAPDVIERLPRQTAQSN